MLPPATQRQVVAALPNTVDIMFRGEVRRYTFPIWWSREDHDHEYPSIVLTLSPRGVLRESDQPLDDVLRRGDVDDPTLAYEQVLGQRLYDVLTVTVVDRGISAGLSASDRASMMADRVARFFRFEARFSELAEHGPGRNQVPVVIPTPSVSGPEDRSGMVDDTAVARFEVSARLNYTYTSIRQVAAVHDVDIQSSTSGP